MITWESIVKLSPGEASRMRYCRGCKYIGIAGNWGCCDYFLITGKLRQCPFGKGCTAKEVCEEVPQDHGEYIERMEHFDRIAQERKAKRDRRVPGGHSRLYCHGEPTRPEGVMTQTGKQWPSHPTWDTEYGFWLYQRGYRIRQIGDVFGKAQTCIRSFAQNHRWCEYKRDPVRRTEAETKKAREAYEQFLIDGDRDKLFGRSTSKDVNASSN